eukprot:8151515-Heterocapsa_arctica.AAC.1
MAWMPGGDDWKNRGRHFLTDQSPHAQEVLNKQLQARAEFFESRGFPDGYDGITSRQLLEAMATVQGGLSTSMLEGITGAIARWMASESGEHPPHYDDVLCPCGGWHFGSAL